MRQMMDNSQKLLMRMLNEPALYPLTHRRTAHPAKLFAGFATNTKGLTISTDDKAFSSAQKKFLEIYKKGLSAKQLSK